MTITGGTALPKEEIDRMMREAEQFADEDAKRRVEAEARNQADNLVYQTEKLLSENGDKIPAGDRDDVQKALDEVKDALKGTDISAITAASERLVAGGSEGRPGDVQRAAGRVGCGRRWRRRFGDGRVSSDDVVDAEVVDEGDQQ